MNTKKPDIFLFNPTCEYAVANEKASWQPNRLLKKMEYDLSTLPMFFASSEDYILTEKIPSEKFLATFKEIGFHPPKFFTENSIKNEEFVRIKKGKLKPWGWSPAVHQKLASLKQNCSKEFHDSPVANWKPGYRNLYSKKFALEILRKLTEKTKSKIFIHDSLLPKTCSNQNEIENLFKNWGSLMVKAPWSSSGRGLQKITKSPIHTKVWEKINGIINDQGYVMVEPYLNKILDLAFQFELIKGKITFSGISNFITDAKGQYTGNYLNGLPHEIHPEIKNFAESIPDIIIEPLINILEQSELAEKYEGTFGVDTLIYLDNEKKIKINPCLEINVRQNMGLLSLQLEKFIQPGIKGMFRTFYNPETSFLKFKSQMEIKHPLKFFNDKITSGFLALTDADEETLFGAYLIV